MSLFTIELLVRVYEAKEVGIDVPWTGKYLSELKDLWRAGILKLRGSFNAEEGRLYITAAGIAFVDAHREDWSV